MANKPSSNSLFGGDSSSAIPIAKNSKNQGIAVVADDDDDWGNDSNNASFSIKKKESEQSLSFMKYREGQGIGGVSKQ